MDDVLNIINLYKAAHLHKARPFFLKKLERSLLESLEELKKEDMILYHQVLYQEQVVFEKINSTRRTAQLSRRNLFHAAEFGYILEFPISDIVLEFKGRIHG